MSEENKSSESKMKRISLEKLFLDPNNFRLVHEAEQVDVDESLIKNPDVVRRTMRLILGEKNQNIQDLIDSFTSNGYLSTDQIQVRELSGGDFVVIEGNRRIAALKYLQTEYKSKGIDLGRLDSAVFSKVPVVLYGAPNELHHLSIMALNHIGGKKKWPEWNQAKLLDKMLTKHGVSEDDLCKRIGVRKAELRRSIRALALANQYLQSDYGDEFKESMFPIFREVARNVAVKDWLGWNDLTNTADNQQNRELFFSWLSHEPIEEDDKEDQIGGMRRDALEPVITRRDDIVTLSKIIDDPIAMNYIRENRNIAEAFRFSNLIFKEKINSAILSVDQNIRVLSQFAVPQKEVPKLEEALGIFRSVVEKARGNTLKGVESSTVYFDVISKHFSNFTVQKYRGLQDLTISKLSRINLFAGVNNSGKTSLLEAVYLLTKQNDFNGIIDIYGCRGKIAEDSISPRWLSEQLIEKISVSGLFDEKQASVMIEPLIEEGLSIERTRYLKTIDITTEYGTIQHESTTQLFDGMERKTQTEAVKVLCSSVFTSPFFFNEPHRYTSFYHKSVRSKLKPRIEEFISKKILPAVKSIDLADEFQRFLVNDDRFETAMDLTNYGEGLQKIFFTALLFASAKDGVLLIDEFENAIHTDLIESFVPFVHALAKEFNVQVFLTSHSKECIDSFIKTVREENVDDFTFNTLVNSGEKIEVSEVREFSGKEFSKMLRVLNADLRRLK